MTDKEFEQLLKDHIYDSLNFCRRFSKREDDAELLKSYALERAWSNRYSFDETKAKFKTWFYTIIRNSAIDIYRASPKGIYFSIEEPWEHPAVDCIEERFFNQSMINNLTYTLETEFTKREVTLFKESIYEGYKYREVAEKYKISINTLKVLIHRIRIYLSDPKNIKMAPTTFQQNFICK